MIDNGLNKLQVTLTSCKLTRNGTKITIYDGSQVGLFLICLLSQILFEISLLQVILLQFQTIHHGNLTTKEILILAGLLYIFIDFWLPQCRLCALNKTQHYTLANTRPDLSGPMLHADMIIKFTSQNYIVHALRWHWFNGSVYTIFHKQSTNQF